MSSVIIIFSKKGCKFCEKAKAILDRCGLEYEEIDVTDDDHYLANMRSSGATVPRVWRDSMFVGGYTELVNHLYERGFINL